MAIRWSRRHFLESLSWALIGVAFCASCMPYVRAEESGDNLRVWNNLPESEKELIRKRWEQFKAMDPKERAELESAMVRFQALPEKQKAEIRENFAIWKTLSPEERAEIRLQFTRWKDLPEDVKTALREKAKGWDELSETERKVLLDQVRSTPAR